MFYRQVKHAMTKLKSANFAHRYRQRRTAARASLLSA
jgi:hypothetical protein